MEVRLSRVQYRCLRQALAGQPSFISWFNEAERMGDRWWRVVMPAIAWQRSIDQLAAVTFNAAGQRRGKVPRAATRALMHVARAMVVRRAHPAFKGLALPEWSNEVLPAWRQRADRFSPFPMLDTEFVVLVPRWDKLSGLEITHWVPGTPPVEHRIFAEDAHLVFGYYDEIE